MLCCFALFVCLTLLASFFHLSFKNMYIYMYVYMSTTSSSPQKEEADQELETYETLQHAHKQPSSPQPLLSAGDPTYGRLNAVSMSTCGGSGSRPLYILSNTWCGARLFNCMQYCSSLLSLVCLDLLGSKRNCLQYHNHVLYNVHVHVQCNYLFVVTS